MTTLLLASLLLAQSPTAGPLPLRVTMISLGVKDATRAARFYQETLGLSILGKPGEVTMIKAGDVTIVLNAPLGRSTSEPAAGAVEVIFSVESVAAAQQTLAGRGCNFLIGPHEVTPGLWAATFTDPDGHKLTLLGPH
jgi:predicted enzyme related to lactoylglutathione lyase